MREVYYRMFQGFSKYLIVRKFRNADITIHIDLLKIIASLAEKIPVKTFVFSNFCIYLHATYTLTLQFRGKNHCDYHEN